MIIDVILSDHQVQKSEMILWDLRGPCCIEHDHVEQASQIPPPSRASAFRMRPLITRACIGLPGSWNDVQSLIERSDWLAKLDGSDRVRVGFAVILFENRHSAKNVPIPPVQTVKQTEIIG